MIGQVIDIMMFYSIEMIDALKNKNRNRKSCYWNASKPLIIFHCYLYIKWILRNASEQDKVGIKGEWCRLHPPTPHPPLYVRALHRMLLLNLWTFYKDVKRQDQICCDHEEKRNVFYTSCRHLLSIGNWYDYRFLLSSE